MCSKKHALQLAPYILHNTVHTYYYTFDTQWTILFKPAKLDKKTTVQEIDTVLLLLVVSKLHSCLFTASESAVVTDFHITSETHCIIILMMIVMRDHELNAQYHHSCWQKAGQAHHLSSFSVQYFFRRLLMNHSHNKLA